MTLMRLGFKMISVFAKIVWFFLLPQSLYMLFAKASCETVVLITGTPQVLQKRSFFLIFMFVFFDDNTGC